MSIEFAKQVQESKYDLCRYNIATETKEKEEAGRYTET
jgi:hypothetical protein